MPDKSPGEQSYEQFADRYAAMVETKPHNAYLARPAVLPLLPDVGGKRVLDAGCGSGWYSEQFINSGAQVVAIDVTPAFIEIASRRLGDRATVLRHDLSQPLDFAADAGFDLVFSNLVLDYIEDWGAVFAEFNRVLVPGGVLVFSCGHPAGDWQWMKQNALPVEGGPHYFKTQRFDAYWSGFGEPKPLVMGYRRPLAAMLNR